MLQIKKIRKSVVLGIIILALIGGWTLQLSAASANSIYLSPGSKSIAKNKTFTIKLRVRPATPVNAVKATVNFDSSKLEYKSVTGASVFPIELAKSVGNGFIALEYGNLGGSVTIDSPLASITFKAKTSSGSTPIKLSNYNATKADGSGFTSPSAGNATITIKPTYKPKPKCPSGQTGTPPHCVTPKPPSGGGGGTKPSSHKDSHSKKSSKKDSKKDKTSKPKPAAPRLLSSATSVAFTKADVTVTSSAPTTAYLHFGIDGQTNIKSPVSKMAKSHNISIDQKYLVPGKTYSYIVVLNDSHGHTVKSPVKTFKTKGLPIKIKVTDKNKQPLKNIRVTLHSTPQTVKTDESGYAVFTDTVPGNHTLVHKNGSKTYEQPIKVANNVKVRDGVQSAAEQDFAVSYNFVQSSTPVGLYVIIAILLVALAVAGYWYFFILKRDRRPLEAAFTGTSTGYVAPSISPSDKQDDEFKNAERPDSDSDSLSPSSNVVQSNGIKPDIDRYRLITPTDRAETSGDNSSPSQVSPTAETVIRPDAQATVTQEDSRDET